MQKIKEQQKNKSRTGLNKDQRIARDNAESDDEHAVNFIEKTSPTEDCIQHVTAVHAEVPTTAPWHNMRYEALGPDHWREIGYPSIKACIEMYSEMTGIDTSTGKAKYSATQIYLDLYPAGYISYANHNVDKFDISAIPNEYVESVDDKTSSKKAKREQFPTK